MRAFVGKPRRSAGTLHGHNDAGYRAVGRYDRREAGDYNRIG
jgi:hypothetical protein